MKIGFHASAPVLAIVAAISVCTTLPAASQGHHHPDYEHAVGDMLAARWDLAHRADDAVVHHDEDRAIDEIDKAVSDARKAARIERKELGDRPGNVSLDRPARLREAVALLRKSRQDLGQEEDNPDARAFLQHSISHLDHAIDVAEHAVHDAEHGR